MWQEARKHEKKLRGIMVDHRKRQDRKREYYEKVKQDPVQFLQVHGQSYKVHLDPTVSIAAENPKNMMPWQGDTDNMIDRYDARAQLDVIPVYKAPKTEEPVEDAATERRCTYESYRLLVKNAVNGQTEGQVLRRIQLDERFPVSSRQTSSNAAADKKKLADKKAAIGYVYDGGSGGGGRNFGSDQGGGVGDSDVSSSDEDSDDDQDDLDFDLVTMNPEQLKVIAKVADKYGMSKEDVIRYMGEDKAENDRLDQAKIIEDEKAMFSGRKSRRERRAIRDRQLWHRHRSRSRSPVQLSYATRDSPTYHPYRLDVGQGTTARSISRSASPQEAVKFITSFGAEEEDEEEKGVFHGPALPSRAEGGEKLSEKKKRSSRSRSRDKRKGHRSRSRDSRSRRRSRSRDSRSRRRSRSRDSRSRRRSRSRDSRSRRRSRSQDRRLSKDRMSRDRRSRSRNQRRSRSRDRSRRSRSRDRSRRSRSRDRYRRSRSRDRYRRSRDRYRRTRSRDRSRRSRSRDRSRRSRDRRSRDRRSRDRSRSRNRQSRSRDRKPSDARSQSRDKRSLERKSSDRKRSRSGDTTTSKPTRSASQDRKISKSPAKIECLTEKEKISDSKDVKLSTLPDVKSLAGDEKRPKSTESMEPLNKRARFSAQSESEEEEAEDRSFLARRLNVLLGDDEGGGASSSSSSSPSPSRSRHSSSSSRSPSPNSSNGADAAAENGHDKSAIVGYGGVGGASASTMESKVSEIDASRKAKTKNAKGA